MDSYPQPDSSIIEMPPPPPGILGSKIPSSVTFAVIVILFLLPFAQIKCKSSSNDSSFFSGNSYSLSFTNTGLGLAMGSKWKFNMPDLSSLFNDGMKSPKDDGKNDMQSTKANKFAIIALALAVVGLGLSFMSSRSGATINIAAGILGACALIGLMINLKSEINKKLSDDVDKKIWKSDQLPFELSFTPWFYIAVIAFLAAAFFSYKRMRAIK